MERFLFLWDEIDELAGGLQMWWRITAADLRDLRNSLADLIAGAPREVEPPVSNEA